MADSTCGRHRRGGPGTPAPQQPIEMVLAQQANDAITKGADPHAVTDMLGKMLRHLKANPQQSKQATDALAQGAHPDAISSSIWAMANDPQDAIHQEYASGNLAKRMQRLNQNDQDQLTATTSAHPALESLAATAANVGEGIPGFEAVQAAIAAKANGIPYAQALSDLRGETGKLPTALRVGERIAGSLPVSAALSKIPGGSPAVAGAVLGGADQALAADPESLAERAGKTAVGAATGGLVGKAVGMGTTAGQALFAQNPAANVLARQSVRALSAKKLYDAALAEGQGQTGTATIQQFLAEPDIAEIVKNLQGTRPFANTAPDSPEMLDAVYKTLSDHAASLQKGAMAIQPNRPNTGRYAQQDVGMAQGQLLNAVDPVMPTYRTAVEDYAQKSADLNAVGKGMNAMQGNPRPSFNQILNKNTKTPETFADWASGAPQSQVDAAREGILGDVSNSFKQPGMTFGPARKALSQAGPLLRSASSPTQDAVNLMQRLGLTGANALFASPQQ